MAREAAWAECPGLILQQIICMLPSPHLPVLRELRRSHLCAHLQLLSHSTRQISPCAQVCRAWELAVAAALTQLTPARADPAFWQRLPQLRHLDLSLLRGDPVRHEELLCQSAAPDLLTHTGPARSASSPELGHLAGRHTAHRAGTCDAVALETRTALVHSDVPTGTGLMSSCAP